MRYDNPWCASCMKPMSYLGEDRGDLIFRCRRCGASIVFPAETRLSKWMKVLQLRFLAEGGYSPPHRPRLRRAAAGEEVKAWPGK